MKWLVLLMAMGPSLGYARALSSLRIEKVIEHCQKNYGFELKPSQFGPKLTGQSSIRHLINEEALRHYRLHHRLTFALKNPEDQIRNCLADFGLTLGMSDMEMEWVEQYPYRRSFDRIRQMVLTHPYTGQLLKGEALRQGIARLESRGLFIALDLGRRIDDLERGRQKRPLFARPGWWSRWLIPYEARSLRRDLNRFLSNEDFVIDFHRSAIASHLSSETLTLLEKQGSSGLIAESRLRETPFGPHHRLEILFAVELASARSDQKIPLGCKSAVFYVQERHTQLGLY